MEKQSPPWTLSELAELLAGIAHGPSDLILERVTALEEADERGVAFAENDTYLALASASKVGAVLVPKGKAIDKPCVEVDSPRNSFGLLLGLSVRPLPIRSGVHPTAIVDPSACVHETAFIGPYAVIERGAIVGARSKVFAFTYVGENCVVGEDCVLYPHVVMYQDVNVGDRVVVHAGTVLGADGFGYVWDGKKRIKVPQVGSVNLGNDVEIGVLTAVDRATAGSTSVGRGSKIDNLVQVAHNVVIGEDTVIAAKTGVSGSSKIGSRVVVAGNVDFSDHVSVGDDITLAGRTGVTGDLTEPGTYFGLPARPIGEAMRSLMLVTKLPDILSRLRRLEKNLEGGAKKE